MASTSIASARGLLAIALMVLAFFILITGLGLVAIGIALATQPAGHASGPAFGGLVLVFGVAFVVAAVLAFKSGRGIYDDIDKTGTSPGSRRRP
jgi:hypothetical protein